MTQKQFCSNIRLGKLSRRRWHMEKIRRIFSFLGSLGAVVLATLMIATYALVAIIVAIYLFLKTALLLLIYSQKQAQGNIKGA